MSLPHGWTLASLGGLVTLQTGPFGTSLHQSDYVTGGTPIVNPMHIRGGRIRPSAEHTVAAQTVERLSDFKLLCGDIVIGRRGEMGRCAVVTAREQGWLCGTGSMIIRCTVALLPAFLQRLLTTRESVDFLGQESVGSTMANLNQKILLGLPVRLPPMAEQQRIVDSLETSDPSLDDAVAELATAKRKLALYRQSLLKSAVEGKLTAEWRGESTEVDSTSRATCTEAWAGIPSGWRWSTAESECGFITKGTTPPKSLTSEGAKCVPFLRVTNLTRDGSLDFSDQVFVAEDVHRKFLARSIVKPGDVLMNIVGPPLGQVSMVPSTFPEWNVNQAIAIFRVQPGLLNEFLAYLLLSPGAGRWLQARAKTTAGQTNLTLEVCRGLPVPVPPLAEQAEIVRLLNQQLGSLTEQGQAIDRALAMASAQRQNILRAAFSGQLVPQDLNDEPASVLLERIRAQGQAAVPSTKRKPGRPAKVTA